MRPHHLIAPTLAAALLCHPGAYLHAQAVTVESVLAAAGTYLATFRQAVSGVVLEEEYLQQSRAQVLITRELRSDLSVMADPELGWIEFRDVFEVDRKPVRDRDDRVMKLFMDPLPDSLRQARRIVQEGARFNLTAFGAEFDRTINLPMATLMYLRQENQSRSTFRRVADDNVAGQRTVKLRFTETATPRMIASSDGSPAEGAFWIEPVSGRVLRTELILRTRRGITTVDATIRVDYAENKPLQLWLPREMEEGYSIAASGGRQVASISGRALYSNARKFRVAVDERPSEQPSSERPPGEGPSTALPSTAPSSPESK